LRAAAQPEWIFDNASLSIFLTEASSVSSKQARARSVAARDPLIT